MLFHIVGGLFQDKTVDKAKCNIGALSDARPEKALVFRGDNLVIENPKEIKVGEVTEVKVGERIPLDGTMQDGVAAFNTTTLTDESVPRNIRKGEEIPAGMTVTDKVIRLEVTRPFDRSALARILELVQSASERKTPVELFIHKFTRIYTPVVITLAVLIVLYPFAYPLIDPPFVFASNDRLYRALVFLVISCPYAPVVGIPLDYFGGIGAASRLGVLFKSSNYLDAITKINTVVLDKTGTLTKGTFKVQACKSAGEASEKELVKPVASVESDSTHPITKAVMDYVKEQNIECVAVTGTKEFAGYGLETVIDGTVVLVDDCRLLSKLDISYPKEPLEITDTIVACAVGDRYADYLLLADVLKRDARVAVDSLEALDVENIQILSGDKQSTVTNFAGKLGISKAYGDLLPEGRVGHLEELQRDEANRIAFVGDGMNDAPVLTLNHVDIATGGLGSDAAIETADVVIQADQPSKMTEVTKVGKLTRRIIWWNVSLVSGMKLLVLILGAGGIATLWEAVFTDMGVALLTTINAVRIQKMIKQERNGRGHLSG